MKMSESSLNQGSLTIVGTGIRAGGQLTLEAKGCIEMAENLFYLVVEPATERFLVRLNPAAESLHYLYSEGKPRIDTYLEMIEVILAPVRRGRRVCVAFYGHPGTFVYSSHEAIRKARSEGFPARMMPAPSALDCLIADLGFDPAMGCQSFEATNFLLRKGVADASCLFILWQIGVIGDLYFSPELEASQSMLALLADYLLQFYDEGQPVVLYEASTELGSQPRVEWGALSALPQQRVSSISTLCIPPARAISYDEEMIKKLGLDHRQLDRAGIQVQIPRNNAGRR
ncbi:MAG TPA: SAM-dependent methyltransferase [Trebonia sp.]|nr:SAM-dependent methyltransferase [Trebonia sp.]